MSIFTKLANWMFSDTAAKFEESVKNVQTLIAANQLAITQKDAELERIQLENNQLNQQLQTMMNEQVIEEERRKSDEPWVNIRSANFDSEKGIKIELDWNEAFVKHLRASGIKGATDDIVVQKWLAFLYEDLIVRMERTIIEQPEEKQTVSDYE